MTQNIYFDESGYTGNNLLHPKQKFFAYASVATDDVEAKDFVEGIISKYGIQGRELKGKNLLKFGKGRKAIDEIFSHFDGRLKISVSDKKFALACKFYEYIFEPCYSEINSLFYDLGFHRFIANILYMEFSARGAGAEEIFVEFEDLMRTGREAGIKNIFLSSVHDGNSPVLTQIREFAQYRAEDVRAELAGLTGVGAGKWILDLTSTSLFTLLSNWGTEYEQITAICDPSRPLQADQSLFTEMIGREDRIYSNAFGESHPITFNLSGPLLFQDSKIAHGIQIADVIAAASVYVMSGAGDKSTDNWRVSVAKQGANGSIIPDMDAINLGALDVQRNLALLMELHSRAQKGQSLIDGIDEYARMVTHRLKFNPMFPPDKMF
jgi:hypothetical protein